MGLYEGRRGDSILGFGWVIFSSADFSAACRIFYTGFLDNYEILITPRWLIEILALLLYEAKSFLIDANLIHQSLIYMKWEKLSLKIIGEGLVKSAYSCAQAC